MIRDVLSLESLRALTAEEAAALLLVRQDINDDDHDDAVLTAWIESDPANGLAWARACTLWEQLEDQVPVRASVGNADFGLASSPLHTRWRYAMAASIALALIGGTALMVQRRDAHTAQVASVGTAPLTLATARGEGRSFTLADGSRVTLDTNTVVRVGFQPGGERRIALLHGQAAFAVAHDRSRPFVVSVGDRSITALGTRFEVRADTGLFRVVLVEGSVAVRLAKSAIVLKPGEQLTTQGTSPPLVTTADPGAVGNWQRGLVTFHNTPLSVAAAEMNRYSPTPLAIRGAIVAGYRVSGTFHTNDAARFARAVAELYPVRVVQAPGRLELIPTPSAK